MVSSFLLVHHSGQSQAKVGAKGMNGHGPSHVCRLEDVSVEGFVGGIKHDLEEGNDDHLEGAGLP